MSAMIEYVELAAAKERATEIRMIVSAVVPSPWSEAAKGLFRLAQLPILVVRALPRDREIAAWTGIDNVPVVVHGAEPARSTWSAIVGLVARLAPGVVLPEEPAARAGAIGLVELIAGEDGIGWNGRLAMIHDGFTEPAKSYLAKRYGYSPAAHDGVRDRVAARLAHLAVQLGGRDYFGGARPNAVDVYTATFLTPLFPITDADCPKLAPPLRQAFGAAAATFGALVPAELAALRTRMFERHLAWPLEL